MKKKKINKVLWLGILLAVIIVLLLVVFLRRGPTGEVILGVSPTLCSGDWSYCTFAIADDGYRATVVAKSGLNRSGVWNNYNVQIPASASVDKVTVKADFFSSYYSKYGYLDVQVSGDGGRTYGPHHHMGGNTYEQRYVIDVTKDVAWTPGKLLNRNLRVKATCFKQGLGFWNPICKLDWLPVEVNYSEFDFRLRLNNSAADVVAGDEQVATSTVDVLRVSGGSAPVVLYLVGCPPQATCTVNPNFGDVPFDSLFKVVTSELTPAGIYRVNITGVGGGKTRSVTYTLQVDAVTNCKTLPPSVSLLPDQKTAQAGSSLVYIVKVTNNDLGSCNFSWFNISSSIPLGWIRYFGFSPFLDPIRNTTLVISPGGSKSAKLLLISNKKASIGDYPFSIHAKRGQAESVSASGIYGVNSLNSFDFSIYAFQDFPVGGATGSILPGGIASTPLWFYRFQSSDTNGPQELVQLTYEFCPPDATCSFTPDSGTTVTYNFSAPVPPSSNFTIVTSTTTPPGNYIIVLKGVSASGFEDDVTFHLFVPNPYFDFSVSMNPSSGSVKRGSFITTKSEIFFINATEGDLVQPSLIEGCPPLSTCTTPGGLLYPPFYSHTYTFKISTLDGTGTYPIKIWYTDGMKARNAVYTLTVT